MLHKLIKESSLGANLEIFLDRLAWLGSYILASGVKSLILNWLLDVPISSVRFQVFVKLLNKYRYSDVTLQCQSNNDIISTTFGTKIEFPITMLSYQAFACGFL